MIVTDLFEGAPISGDGGAVANFNQQMANNTEVAYQKNLKAAGVAENYDDEPDECWTCRGTGEGQHEGQTCSVCHGSGVEPGERDDDDFDIPDDYYEDVDAPWPFQQVNELSNEKLGQYKKAAGADATAADKRGDFERGNKRFRGITTATKKQFSNDIKKHYASREQGVAEGSSEIKIPTEDGITMQDIRLMAGEGPLTKKTVLQAIAVIRKQRREQGVADGSLNELSSDLLQRSARLAKDKSNQAMAPDVHNALGGGYMNPLAKHYDAVSQKIGNRATQVGKKEIVKKIASPATMRKIGISEQDMAQGSLNEFAPVGGNDREPNEEEILFRLAKQWWLGSEQDMIRVERTLASMGWEIGEDEGYDDGGVFVVRAGDINGKSYMSWPHEDLINEGIAEGSKKRCMQCGMKNCKCPGDSCKCKPAAGWIPGKGFKKAIEEAALNEKWSQKYKSSINCSHPKGFSQKAHCAGKKKHNESVEMEMVCEDCGMCQTHGNLNEIKKGQKDSNGYTRCWPGKHAEGTKKGRNGGQVRNCVPNESVDEAANAAQQAAIAINMKKHHKKPKGVSEDEELDGMALGELTAIVQNTKKIYHSVKNGTPLEAWMYKKITNSNEALTAVAQQINNPAIREPEGVDEGFVDSAKKLATGAALAGSLALGGGAAHAQNVNTTQVNSPPAAVAQAKIDYTKAGPITQDSMGQKLEYGIPVNAKGDFFAPSQDLPDDEYMQQIKAYKTWKTDFTRRWPSAKFNADGSAISAVKPMGMEPMGGLAKIQENITFKLTQRMHSVNRKLTNTVKGMS